jgi:hypothetical protein
MFYPSWRMSVRRPDLYHRPCYLADPIGSATVMVSVVKIQSEVFLREDIRNILRAIDRANSAAPASLETGQAELAAYRAGFAAAVQAVATAFDLSVEQHLPESDRGLLRVPHDAKRLTPAPDTASGGNGA